MSADCKTSTVMNGLIVGFVALAAAFLLNPWGRPPRLPTLAMAEPMFTNTATVRLSAAQLIRSGGDATGLDCYACHEKGKQSQLHLDANNRVVLPKEHADLVMLHGQRNRNDNCYNCHDPEHLDMLKTLDGQHYKWEESTKLCASCHGPTYRDWEAGIHGRTSGYWSQALGPADRAECASCHHPHAPGFPPLKPGPGPHPLHPKAETTTKRSR